MVSTINVAEQLFPDVDLSLCPWTRVSNYLGRTVTVPVVKCFIRCPFDVGESCKRSYQVVFTGSIPGVKDHNSPDSIANNCYYNFVQLLKMCKQLKLDLVD